MSTFSKLAHSLGGGFLKTRRARRLVRNASHDWARQDRDEAVAKLRRAVDIASELPESHYLLGRYLMRLGAFQEAEAALSAALERSRFYPQLLNSQVFLAIAKAKLAVASGEAAFLPAPALPDPVPFVSVIICSIDASRFAKSVAQYDRLLEAIPHEIIGIHDATSLCEGYNRGVRQSRGDLLVFSHDDVDILTPDFGPRLIASLQKHDVVGIVGSTYLSSATWFGSGWPYLRGQFAMPSESGQAVTSYVFGLHDNAAGDVQVMDGFFLAARRSVLLQLPFDEVNFDGWHLYDVDFSFSAHLKGFRCAICNDQLMIHKSHGKFDEKWAFYQDRFLKKHEQNLTFAGKAQFNSKYGAPVKIEVPTVEEWLAITKQLITADYPPGSIKARDPH